VRPLIVPGEIAGDLDTGCRREWLETNGLASFAMGTVAGPGTRRYHAILCAATRPPTGRMVLVNRCEEELRTDGVAHALSSNFYPGTVWPDGHVRLVEFRLDPWPTWIYRCGLVHVERTLFMPHRRQAVVMSWRLLGAAEGSRARLHVKPLISGRDYHSLHHENPALRTEAKAGEGLVELHPYDGVPPVFVHHNGVFHTKADWYRNFRYPAEQARGLDYEEDLFSPGELAFDLSGSTAAVVVFTLEGRVVPDVEAWRASERDRRERLVEGVDDDFEARLRIAADQFVVGRAQHQTIIAGYPWFTDWGRDTFISLPGLALSTGKHPLARELLFAFAPHVRDGLVPNRFPDAPSGDEPEYNTVDAPLWYALAACRYVQASGDRGAFVELKPVLHQIIDAYLAGTRHAIGVDDDGLIHAGEPGLQLTWMDAKVGDWVVTPRVGKPVEIQALWIAALEEIARLAQEHDAAWASELSERAAWARSSFASLFWDDSLGWMYDCVDGRNKDATLRPNQLFALGLTAPLVEKERAERALQAVERELLTPVGLRTRARGDGYIGRYGGDQRERDGAYHQGTVWPYLIGAYADACLRVRGKVPTSLLDGLRRHLYGEGLGSIAEIFEGDAPHAPAGCPQQAWSVAEALRVLRVMMNAP
jgi:predicted glycogen debranching enzyme